MAQEISANPISGRVPPHNNMAEQSVIGSMLLNDDILPQVISMLKPDDFYNHAHRFIYEAVYDLFQKGMPVDIITVSDYLKSFGLLDKAGGISYLSDITANVPVTSNAAYYAGIVSDKAMIRRLINTVSEIMKIGYEESSEYTTMMEMAQQLIFDLSQQKNTNKLSHVKDILLEAFTKLEELYNNKSFLTGVPTGFTDLDRITAGFQKSDLILLAARPAMGKTAVGLNIAQNAAIRGRIPVAVFNLEMSEEQLVRRILCCEAKVDSQKVRTGRLDEEDWMKLSKVGGQIADAPIYIDDTSGVSVSDIRAKCQKLKLEKGLGLVVIDYLQLMQGKRTENRQQEVAEISRSLKIMAKDLNLPVLTLAQLSRAAEGRSDHRPILSDLRDSGAIEQDADIVMFLYRDDYYNENSEKKNVAEIIIAKHRNGSTGVVELNWNGTYTRFEDKPRD